MSRVAQFVALLLIAGLLALPAAALTACGRQAQPMNMPEGCPHCPMTKAAPAPACLQAAPPPGNCCELSSSKPAPASVLHAPSSVSLIAAPSTSGPAVFLVLASRSTASDPIPIPHSASSQAVLCTFLI